MWLAKFQIFVILSQSLCTKEAEVTQNYNTNASNTGQGEDQHRKYDKLGGVQACSCSCD
jgi:hypothetical protein